MCLYGATIWICDLRGEDTSISSPLHYLWFESKPTCMVCEIQSAYPLSQGLAPCEVDLIVFRTFIFVGCIILVVSVDDILVTKSDIDGTI